MCIKDIFWRLHTHTHTHTHIQYTQHNKIIATKFFIEILPFFKCA